MTTNEILDRVSAAVTAQRVFAPPTEQDGITIIPAATIRGGGGGGHNAGTEDGAGGGFGVYAHPAGAIVIDGHDIRWKVPFDLNKVIWGGQLVGVAFFLFSWLSARSTARVAIKIAKINAKALTG